MFDEEKEPGRVKETSTSPGSFVQRSPKIEDSGAGNGKWAQKKFFFAKGVPNVIHEGK